jgi:proteasome accessory factor BC
VLIGAGRQSRRLPVREVCDELQISEQELREDIAVLNVVNFGGGAYVIYAEMLPSGEIEVDPEPYSDTFDRSVRLLPIEGHALVFAIDFIQNEALASARRKVIDALGYDPAEQGLQVAPSIVADDVAHTVERAVHEQHLLELEYYVADEDRLTHRVVEPYALKNGLEGWYIAAFDPSRDALRNFRLDRIKSARGLPDTFARRENLDPVADIAGWPRTGTVEGSRVARVWISPEQARWAREQRTVVAEVEGGAVVVEYSFKGLEYLVKEILKEAGDAAVLEPADAREAVLEAAGQLLQRRAQVA